MIAATPMSTTKQRHASLTLIAAALVTIHAATTTATAAATIATTMSEVGRQTIAAVKAETVTATTATATAMTTTTLTTTTAATLSATTTTTATISATMRTTFANSLSHMHRVVGTNQESTRRPDNISHWNRQIPPPSELEMTFHQYCLAHRNSFADLLTIVLYAIVCIVGLFGNTLVIYVVLRFSKMQTVTNIYILNLAIADECFLIGIPFLLYTMRICSWKFGQYICKAYMVSTSITQFTSSIFLLIMSADRYLAVCHPISSPRYRTLYVAKLVSAGAWLTSAVLMLPVVFYASTVIQEDGVYYSCNIEWPESYKKHSGTTFILYTFILGFATPLCFILCFYYLVIRKLQSVGTKHKSKEKKRSHRKVTRLVLTVITVYILCWLPHWISQVALINTNPGQTDLSRLEILIFLLLGCLVYSNSAINPILYAFLSDNFRKSFSKAFTCMTRLEVNAQLQMEPSVFTKQASRRRVGSKRLMSGGCREPTQLPCLKAAAGNNNSSTGTSSTNSRDKTGTDKIGSGSSGSTTGCAPLTRPIANGHVLAVVERVVLMLDPQEQTVCAVIGEEGHIEADVVLRTDL